jgi:hypothetical protein
MSLRRRVELQMRETTTDGDQQQASTSTSATTTSAELTTPPMQQPPRGRPAAPEPPPPDMTDLLTYLRAKVGPREGEGCFAAGARDGGVKAAHRRTHTHARTQHTYLPALPCPFPLPPCRRL